jgi:hypothetical protein
MIKLSLGVKIRKYDVISNSRKTIHPAITDHIKFKRIKEYPNNISKINPKL